MRPPHLDLETLRDLVKSSGPCLTIFLPPFVPGAQTAPQPGVLLKNVVEEAVGALAARNVNKAEIGELLDPVKRLHEHPDWGKGCRWSRVIFRSPEKFQEFYLHERIGGAVSAAERFDLLPALTELELPPEFFVLKLSKKGAALLRAGFDLEPVPLPGRISEKLDDFLLLDRPDHDRENRAPVSPGGAARRVRFGTGSERETHRAYLHDYYRAIDRALSDYLNPKRPPLLLTGVDEDATLYRSLSTYSNLVGQSIAGSPDGGITTPEILERSYELLRESAITRAVSELAEAQERFAPGRFSTELDSILRFASEGRVGHLYVTAEARDHRDQLNTAAIETIRHGGAASAVPPDRMPNTEAAAALRF